jgi:hypothetical protein
MKKPTQRSLKLKQIAIRDALAIQARLVLVAALSVVPLAPAWAQTPEAQTEAPLQSVQVTGVKDPAIMPYKKVYETLNQVTKVSNGRVKFVIKVTSTETHQPIADLDISLRGEKTFEKINISPAGFITVPLSREAYEDGAEFVTNKKKGVMHVQFYLLPKLSAESFSYGEVVDSIEAARAALAEIIPWYWRLLMPSIKGVGICYPDKQQSVLISNSEEPMRPATSEELHYATEAKIYCANFSSRERGIARDSVISPASGWEPVLR